MIYDSGNGEDRPHGIATDSQGNVIVTGGSKGPNDTLDYYTIKYDRADGHVLWTRRYDGPNNGLDEAIAVGVDSADNVIVTGRSVGLGSGEDIYTVRYVAATGVPNGEFRYTGAGLRTDFPVDLAIDSNGNAIVAGVTTNTNNDTDIYLAKINLTTQTATWTQTIASSANVDDEGKAVAVDSSDNVVVTGILRNADNTHAFHTRKYSSAGVFQWQQTFQSPVDDFNGPTDVAVDSVGNAIVTGTSTLNNFKVTYYTAKYATASGALIWEARSEVPGGTDTTLQEDMAAQVLVDGGDNVVVTGSSQNENIDFDYYTLKYAGTDGHVLWANRLNGDNASGNDTAVSLALDKGGNVAVTGTSKKETGPYFEILTVKYGRFLAATGDEAPGAGVDGSGVPAGAKFSALFTPAIGDNGTVAARVTIAAGKKKKFTAILTESNPGGTGLPAKQNDDAPGVAGAVFKSFLDPVVAPNGRYAFVAKLGKTKSSEASGVWTNALNGTLQLALQEGKQVPGLPDGTMLRSVSSISLRTGQLIALIKVGGKDGGVTKSNSTVLLGINAGGGTSLLRTGQMLTLGSDPETEIKSMSVLNPAQGSPGYGRYHANGRVVARVALADKRTALLSVSTSGVVAPLLYTNQAAPTVGTGAMWKTFGLPAIGTTGSNFAALASAAVGEGNVSKGDDNTLVFSANGTAFSPFAREGDDAPDAGGASYATFFDPLVNAEGDVAFVAGLKGKGVHGSNKAGLWWGTPPNLVKVARLGDSVPDADGNPGTGEWRSFTSTALPSGQDAGPLFLAKVKGHGVNGKNNVGLWGVDTNGLLRQLLRMGDTIGDQTVSRMTLLQALPGSFGATRSFNATGGVVLLVGFTDRTSALVEISVP